MGNRKYSDKDLTEHFMRVWAELGHQPTSYELARFSPPSVSTYLRRFGSWGQFLDLLGLNPAGGGDTEPNTARKPHRRTRGRPLPLPIGAAHKTSAPVLDTTCRSAPEKRPLIGTKPKKSKPKRDAPTRFRLAPSLAAVFMLMLCLGLAVAPNNCGKPYLPSNSNPELCVGEESLLAPYVLEVAVSSGTAGQAKMSALEKHLFAVPQFPERPPVIVAPLGETLAQAETENVTATKPADMVAAESAPETAESAAIAAEPAEVGVGEEVLDVASLVVVAPELPSVTTPGEALIPAEKIEVAVQAKQSVGVPDNTQTVIMAVTEANVFTAALPEPNGEAEVRRRILTVATELLGRAYSLENPNPPESFTCSIFVEYCLKQAGLTVPAPSNTQREVLDAVKCDLENALPYLVPGDVVFFVGVGVLPNGQANPPPGHVGIYVGEGKFIHAAGHARGVVMDSLLQRRDFWGWGSITPLLKEMATPTNSGQLSIITLQEVFPPKTP